MPCLPSGRSCLQSQLNCLIVTVSALSKPSLYYVQELYHSTHEQVLQHAAYLLYAALPELCGGALAGNHCVALRAEAAADAYDHRLAARTVHSMAAGCPAHQISCPERLYKAVTLWASKPKLDSLIRHI